MEVMEPGARYLVVPTHKQTEVGWIPADWTVERLGDHAMFRTGPFGSALHQSDYLTGGIPVINPMQIIDGKIVPTPSMAISEVAAEKLCEFRVRPGDVVIGRRGEMGRCAVVIAEQSGWLCGTGSMIVRGGASIDCRLIQRLLSSAPVVAAIERSAVGTTMVNLNQATLRNLIVPMPPTRGEQEAVADALSDTDALIESLEQLLAKKRQIKQGAMQELLTGQRRLPGFSEPWVATVLGDIGSCARGVTYNPEADLRDGDHLNTLRLLRSNNVQNSAVQFAEMQYVDERRVSPDQVLRNDDLLVCMANGSRELVGKAGRFAEADEHRYTFGAFMARFRPEPDVVAPAFAAFVFQTYRYRAHINLLLAGSSINNLTPAGLSSFNFDLPAERAEQTAIATTLSDMDAEITALGARLAKARQLKQGMMQALLTGRIRLVPPQEEQG